MEGNTGKGTSLGAAVTSICRYADLQDTKVLAAQSCPILWDPLDCSPPGSSVHGICQARILEWVAMPSSRDLPDPGIKPSSFTSPVFAG